MIGRCSIIVVFSCSISIMAQKQYSFRQLTVKDGLSQNSVVAMAQDSLGFLWLATQDGLNRYDGRSFKQYPFQFTDITRPSYSKLGKIYVDRKGAVFIIPSDHKIYKYDQNKDRFFQMGTKSNICAFWQDSSYTYWGGTTEGEIFILDANFEKVKSHLNTKIKGQIKKIGKASNDHQFILSEKSLMLLDKRTKAYKEILLSPVLEGKVAANLSTAVLDKNGRFWLGYYGDGLYYLDNTTLTIQRLNSRSYEGHLPQGLRILDLLFDQKQRLWVTTYGDGLYLIDFQLQKITHFSEQKENPRALHYNDILCAYQDTSGTLWFGTDGAGASFYDADLEKFNSFTNFQTPPNINIDVVRAIALDKDNNIWIGTSGKGLTKYEPETNSWITYTTLNSDIPSNRIMSLYPDANGDLWIGTQGGGLSILTKGLTFHNHPILFGQTNSDATIWDITKDVLGNFWLATRDNGLVKFNKEQRSQQEYINFYLSDTVITRKNIRTLFENPDGSLWIGTNGRGLLYFDPNTGQTKLFSTKNSDISSNAIKSLFYDGKILWIGTSGKGLDAYESNSDTFYNFSKSDGLPNNVIYGILPDDTGSLWLSSNKGITKFTLQDFKSAPAIVNYDNYDGLATEFNTGAYYKHHTGELFFGGLEGFYWFNPQTISENQYLPEVAITDFRVLDNPKSIFADTLLRYNENTLDITFSSLQFSEPLKNQYKYRLLPFENDWVLAGNKNYVRYTRLPPNEYQFQVVSSNYDGKWNVDPEKYNFRIAAPWYFNSWSKTCYALLLLMTAVLVYRYLKWRWRMKLDLQLKEEEANRFKKLNEYRSKIYTEIAHEFRTPLTLISGPIESKLSEKNITSEEAKRFSMIARNTSRLTILVDQLLQLAQLEEGRFQLKNSAGNLSLFLKAALASFEFEAKQKAVAYSYRIGEMPLVHYDEDAMEKIISNLISNALKHGKKKGKCQVTAQFSKGILKLKVFNETEGDAIDPQQFFERFYQKDNRTAGAGIGLSLVQELVKLYQGKIEAVEKLNWIEFHVEIPLHVVVSNVSATQKEIDVSEKSKKPKQNQPMVLVVEDNNDVRDFIRLEFGKVFHVITATNGNSGFEKAVETIPDIVISDIRMPGKDGIALCTALKTDQRTSHIPVILLTASSKQQNELNSLKAGADDYVTKPFKIKILEKRVHNLISARKLLREKYSQERFLKPKDIAITPTDVLFWDRVQKVMDLHLSETDFNATKFSVLVGMSRMQLHRKLMLYSGLTTSAFIRSQRLKQALHILKTSDATVNEVAYAVGFNTPSYFIKCFRETYKKTPSEYVQQLK